MKWIIAFLCMMGGGSIGFSQQRFAVSLGTGIGKYQMEDLEKVSEYHQWSLFYYDGLKQIDTYPAYFFYSGELTMKINKIFSLGLLYRLQSTGAKSAYSDYSGIVRLEHKIKADNAGILLGFLLWQRNKFSLEGQTRVYYGWTKLVVTNHIELYGATENFTDDATYKFNGRSFMLNPDLSMSYDLFKNVALSFSIGYCLDFKAKIIDDFFSSQYVFPITAESDWSGVRIGLSTSYKF